MYVHSLGIIYEEIPEFIKARGSAGDFFYFSFWSKVNQSIELNSPAISRCLYRPYVLKKILVSDCSVL
jgi:hypothetical protein